MSLYWKCPNCQTIEKTSNVVDKVSHLHRHELLETMTWLQPFKTYSEAKNHKLMPGVKFLIFGGEAKIIEDSAQYK